MQPEDMSKSGIIKGERYQNQKLDKKNKSEHASSMEFDGTGAQAGADKNGRSKSVANKNLMFGGPGASISMIKRDNDDEEIINLNFVRKQTNKGQEDPSQVYGMSQQKKKKKVFRDIQNKSLSNPEAGFGLKKRFDVQNSLTSLMNEFIGKNDDRGDSQLKYMMNDKDSSADKDIQKVISKKKPLKEPKNMKLINQIENSQAPYFGINVKEQAEEAYGIKVGNMDKDVMSDEMGDNFKIAR